MSKFLAFILAMAITSSAMSEPIRPQFESIAPAPVDITPDLNRQDQPVICQKATTETNTDDPSVFKWEVRWFVFVVVCFLAALFYFAASV